MKISNYPSGMGIFKKFLQAFFHQEPELAEALAPFWNASISISVMRLATSRISRFLHATAVVRGVSVSRATALI